MGQGTLFGRRQPANVVTRDQLRRASQSAAFTTPVLDGAGNLTGYRNAQGQFRKASKQEAQGYMNQRLGEGEQRSIAEALKQLPGYEDSLLGNKEFQGLQEFAAGGKSALFDSQRERIGLETQSNLEEADRLAAGAQENAYNQLAQGGGLSSGSRERVAQSGLESRLLGRQGTRATGQKLLTDLGVAEAQARMEAQKGVASTLQQEAQRRQQFMQDQAKMRVDATLAQQKAASERQITAANQGCFIGTTLVTMDDGSEKPISEIRLGDLTKGGKVYAIQTLEAPVTLYHYRDSVFVTSSHAVCEDGRFIRVSASEFAKPVQFVVDAVYNIATTEHRIFVAGIEFADLHETDYHMHCNAEQSIDIMNGDAMVEKELCSMPST